MIPRANVIRTDFQTVYVDRNSSYNPNSHSSNNYYLRVDSSTFVGIRYYDTLSKSAGGFFLQRIRGNKVYYNLRAERLQWDTAKKNWKLTNAIERKIEALTESIRKIDTMHVNLNVTPRELKRDEYMKDKLTTQRTRSVLFIWKKCRGTEGLEHLSKSKNTIVMQRHFLVIIMNDDRGHCCLLEKYAVAAESTWHSVLLRPHFLL